MVIKFITIEACDADSIPPVAVGLPAPDFIDISLDSTEVRLSDYKGKYLVLDFWACNEMNGILFANDVYNAFCDNEQFAMISSGPYNPQFLSPEAREIQIRWPHINGSFEVPARMLYQVGGPHTTFFINPEGTIVEKIASASKENFINRMQQHLAGKI